MSLLLLFSGAAAATLTANLVEAGDSISLLMNGATAASLSLQESSDSIVINMLAGYAMAINPTEASDAMALLLDVSTLTIIATARLQGEVEI